MKSSPLQSLLFLSLFLLPACEEEIDWPLDSELDGRLVVDAVLTNQFTYQEIYLSQHLQTSADTNMSISDAEVWVRNADTQIDFIPDFGQAGRYESVIPFAIEKDKIYQLQIGWKEEVYVATAELSFVSPLAEITFDRSLGSDSLQLIQVGAIYHPLEQFMYEVDISWGGLDPTAARQAKLFFYAFSTVDGSQIILPPREKVYFPSGSTVVIRKFGLQADFANYLRSIALETIWQGGLFDAEASNAHSNISRDALGYFALCSVVTDTLTAQ